MSLTNRLPLSGQSMMGGEQIVDDHNDVQLQIVDDHNDVQLQIVEDHNDVQLIELRLSAVIRNAKLIRSDRRGI